MRALITHRDNFGGKSAYELVNALDRIDKVEAVAIIADNSLPVGDRIIASFVHDELAFGDFTNTDWNKIKPIDTNLMQSMTKYEHIAKENVKRMVNLELKDYKEYYLNNLRFWSDFLDKNKIDFCFLCSHPHAGYDYIIYALCKVKSIPILYIGELPKNPVEPVERYEYITDNLEDPLIEVSAKGTLSKDDFSNVTNKFDFYNESYKAAIPKLKDMISKSKTRSRFRAAKKLFQRGDIVTLLEKLVRVKKNEVLIKQGRLFYESVSSEPNPIEKHILVALHFEPEAAISPLGGIFVDQYLMVQMLSYYVPEDIKIYVKEHPIKGYYRKQEYYKKLIDCKNVKLIKKDIKSSDLIKSSMAIATVTGSIGWESLFCKKPVLIFGHCFYQNAPFVFPIRNNIDCQNAINQLQNNNFEDKSKDLNLFMHRLSKYSFKNHEIYTSMEDGTFHFNQVIEEKMSRTYLS